MATGVSFFPATSSSTPSMAPLISKKLEIWKALCKHLQMPQPDSNEAGYRYICESNAVESKWALEFKPLIENLSDQDALLLFDALKDLLHPSVNNEERRRTIQAFLKRVPSAWKELSLQIHHLLPGCSRGHDIMWVSEILSSISHQPYRDELVNTASSLYTWKTSSLERAYILEGLMNSCTTADHLREIQSSSTEKKLQLAQEFIPKSAPH